MGYVTIIKTAMILFPAIAFLLSLPFILSQYHKYGSISFLKSLFIYLFGFYLLCAYFLVILPLPKISEVAVLTTPRMQLIPFDFVIDFVKHSSLNIFEFNTYFKTMKESYFYVPLFNILLTIPFGMFIRYFFHCSFKKTLLYSFLLSLFFELTQLSGLYFLYPRGYRLFDVDDLFLNTLGGGIGYLLFTPFLKIIPGIDKINENARKKGKIVSGKRRSLAVFLDFILLFIIEVIVSFISNGIVSFLCVIIIYYFFIPFVFHMSTFGERFLNIQVLDDAGKENIGRLFLRRVLIIAVYIGIPFLLSSILMQIPNVDIREICVLSVVVFSLLFYILSFLKYFFTSKAMWYEKVSKTKTVSTIK